MNFLAHCHLAEVTKTSVTGNLLGDFVKGPISNLPFSNDIKVGIYLHRKIDIFTDSHPYTKHWKAQLGPWRRYGGIILDMLFDHQLAKRFDVVHSMPLVEFSNWAYRQVSLTDANLPARFERTVRLMTEHDWLTSYASLPNIERALSGIDRRLSSPVNLANSIEWYNNHQAAMEADFFDFYQELTNHTKSLAQASLIERP